MKKLLTIILMIICFLPINVLAITKDYNDIVAPIVGEKIEEDKINIYLFYSDSCPHCHEELEYIENTLIKDYEDIINVYKYEVSKNKNNSKLLTTIKSLYDVNDLGVPFTAIGEEYVFGFGEGSDKQIENILDNYLYEKEEAPLTYNIPIIGEIEAKGASLSIIAIILGFIDGFNPCAMWILLLLINMTIGIKSRKKLLFIGLTFILTGGIVYFLSMLGMGFVIDLATIGIVRKLIAIVAVILGIYNINVFIKTRKETGCHVVNKDKRKGIIKKINNILSKNNLLLAILGTIILAISVNLVELACSLGFPTIYLELLSVNEVVGFSKIIYLIIYIIFYLLDDLIIFFIAVFTLQSKGISTKYNKYVNLIGGILMILMGILLMYKPEWIMFNF